VNVWGLPSAALCSASLCCATLCCAGLSWASLSCATLCCARLSQGAGLETGSLEATVEEVAALVATLLVVTVLVATIPVTAVLVTAAAVVRGLLQLLEGGVGRVLCSSALGPVLGRTALACVLTAAGVLPVVLRCLIGQVLTVPAPCMLRRPRRCILRGHRR
jgi:hypothetical protein